MPNRAGRALLVVAVVWLAGCGDDEAPPTEQQSYALAVAPESIVLSDTETTAELFLTTTPSGGRLSWRVAGAPEWLALEPDSGTVDGEIAMAVVTAPGLAEADVGTYRGTLSLISEGGSASVDVQVDLAASPEAHLSVTELDIPESEDSVAFFIHNVGRGSLEWGVASASPSLQLQPVGGWVAFRDSMKVTVRPERDPLAAGEHEASVTLATNGVEGGLTIPVRIHVAPAPVASVGSSRLGFMLGEDTLTTTLVNTGKGTLIWTAEVSDPWLSTTPSSGELEPGVSAELSVAVDRTVSGDEATGTLTIASNSVEGPVEVTALVTRSTGLPLGFTVLDHRVLDAAYDDAGLIVTVSTNSSRLNVIDLLTGTMDSVSLNLPPTAVAVQPGGGYAAVGHDGAISYVDLNQLSVERVYPVGADVFDIVLPGNGWVYAMPRVDQWQEIHSIDLETGVDSHDSGTVRAGTVMKLHPSGDYMYGADRGLSPSDFEKYDIRGGPAVVLYDSPYHGDYSFGGDIWISGDGTRLFARTGNVFRSSPVRSEDMIYAGHLAGVDWLRSLSAREALGRVLALPASDWGATPSSEVRVYGPEYLALIDTFTLPDFPHPSEAVASLGQFVFATGDGEAAYFLVQADPAAGVLQDWAILKMLARELP